MTTLHPCESVSNCSKSAKVLVVTMLPQPMVLSSGLIFPPHYINQPVYYFILRCVTFTMDTEIPMSAWAAYFLSRGSYTEKQGIISYLANREPKGRLILTPAHHLGSCAHLPATGTAQPPVFFDSSIPMLLWASSATWTALTEVAALVDFEGMNAYAYPCLSPETLHHTARNLAQ